MLWCWVLFCASLSIVPLCYVFESHRGRKGLFSNSLALNMLPCCIYFEYSGGCPLTQGWTGSLEQAGLVGVGRRRVVWSLDLVHVTNACASGKPDSVIKVRTTTRNLTAAILETFCRAFFSHLVRLLPQQLNCSQHQQLVFLISAVTQ